MTENTMPDDIHILPVGDIREHTERRDCWCEPEIKWACDACYIDDVLWPDGSIAGHDHADTCSVCNGSGWVSVRTSAHCVVIHKGRP
jgi:hypothetical protein